MHTIPAPPIASDVSARAIERNLWSFNEAFARLPRSRSHRGYDVSWVSTGTVAFNRVYDARLAPIEVEDCVAGVLAHFRGWRQSFAWQITPSTRPADLGAVLEDNGFRHTVSLAGMACELDGLAADAPAPPGFTMRDAVSPDDVAAWVDVLVRANAARPELERAWRELFTRLRAGYDVPWQLQLGCLDGVPVATCLTHRAAGAIGLYCVSTVRGARRRGVAAALVAETLGQARERGDRLATLQCEADVQPFYHRLGFTERCRIEIYKWTPDVETR